MVSKVPELEDHIRAEDDKIQALEDKVPALETKLEALGIDKAKKFVAFPPVCLKEDAWPQQLCSASPDATAVHLGEGSCIEAAGVQDVLGWTRSWSVSVSIWVQGQGVEGSSMSCFRRGKTSLALKVQGLPEYASSYGQYNTSSHDWYHTAARFNSNLSARAGWGAIGA